MSRSCSSIALLLGALSNSIVFALMPSTEQPSPASRHLKRASSPFDHSDIKHYAAIGDSFAAGLGAGTRLTGWGDWYCSRYDNAYPVLINTNPALGDSSGRKFDFWACSGAVTTDVVNKQIPSLDKPDMVTLSIGGNDANLKDILHAVCLRPTSSLLFVSSLKSQHALDRIMLEDISPSRLVEDLLTQDASSSAYSSGTKILH